jgi:hypothetical protein
MNSLPKRWGFFPMWEVVKFLLLNSSLVSSQVTVFRAHPFIYPTMKISISSFYSAKKARGRGPWYMPVIPAQEVKTEGLRSKAGPGKYGRHDLKNKNELKENGLEA